MRTRMILAAVGVALAAQSASAFVVAKIEVICQVNNQQVGQPAVWTMPLPPATGSSGWGTTTGTNAAPVYIVEPNQSYLDWQAAGSIGDAPVDADPGIAVHGVNFGWVDDPVVTSSFNVSSGLANASFTVNASLVSFGTLFGATGRASAGITVTDSATFGTRGQIFLTGLNNAKAFSALYNGANPGEGTSFVDLLPSTGMLSLPQGTSLSFSDSTAFFNDPQYFPVGDISSISSQFRFTLSAGDRAAGTSVFEVIPAPGAAALLGLGGLLAARRRR